MMASSNERPDIASDRIASCSCGQLRARTAGEPLRVSVCHCLACQRRTGSVFSAQARYAADAVAVSGTSRSYVRTGDGGNRITFRFCPDCGATVWYTIEGRDDAILIPVGAFADPRFPPPTFSVYEERMHDWVVVPPGIERMP